MRAVAAAAVLLVAVAWVTGCGGSTTGSSTGTYTNTGLTQVTIFGTVVDANGKPQVGHSVKVDRQPSVVTDDLGKFTINLPVALVSPTANTFRVFDPQGRLEYIKGVSIPLDCCITLDPFVVGPPLPP